MYQRPAQTALRQGLRNAATEFEEADARADALSGNCQTVRRLTRPALASALCGDAAQAEKLAAETSCAEITSLKPLAALSSLRSIDLWECPYISGLAIAALPSLVERSRRVHLQVFWREATITVENMRRAQMVLDIRERLIFRLAVASDGRPYRDSSRNLHTAGGNVFNHAVSPIKVLSRVEPLRDAHTRPIGRCLTPFMCTHSASPLDLLPRLNSAVHL